MARSRSGGKSLFAALDDDEKSIGWTRGGGETGDAHPLHEDSAPSDVLGTENGKSLRLLAIVGTHVHVSAARCYSHDLVAKVELW